jgi:hypothetical protein
VYSIDGQGRKLPPYLGPLRKLKQERKDEVHPKRGDAHPSLRRMSEIAPGGKTPLGRRELLSWRRSWRCRGRLEHLLRKISPLQDGHLGLLGSVRSAAPGGPAKPTGYDTASRNENALSRPGRRIDQQKYRWTPTDVRLTWSKKLRRLYITLGVRP